MSFTAVWQSFDVIIVYGFTATFDAVHSELQDSTARSLAIWHEYNLSKRDSMHSHTLSSAHW